jgi:hypothetical protein
MGKLMIYFKDGRVFEYEVVNAVSARAHMAKIWEHGYRTVSSGDLEWYGSHYIDKIKYKPTKDEILSDYPDTVRGT